MHIRKLAATFGRLENSTLELDPGLTIIEAPNEGGKSTWTAFLRVMFYGLNTRDRTPQADKRRYLPWSGSPMEGRMDLVAGNDAITLIRHTARANSPMGAFSAQYTGSAEPVPWLTAANCGEELLGVPQEVYERSAFIRQSGMVVDQSPALEQRIAALITTGEEDTSYTAAAEQLRRQQNRRRYNKSGLLPQLEQDCAQLRNLLEQIRNLEEEAAACEVRQERLAQREQELRQQLALHDAADRSREVKEALSARDTWEAARQKAQALAQDVQALPSRSDLEALRGALQGLTLEQEAASDAAQEAQKAKDILADADRALSSAPLPDQSLPEAPPKNGLLLPLLSVAAGILIAALLSLVSTWPVAVIAGILAAALGIGSSLFLSRSRRSRWEAGQAARRRQQEQETAAYTVLKERADAARDAWQRASAMAEASDLRWRQSLQRAMEQVRSFQPGAVSDIEDALVAVEGALARRSAAEQALREEEAAALRWELRRPTVQDAPAAAVERPVLSRSQLQAELSSNTAGQEELRRRRHTAQGQIQALGDSAQLEAELAEKEERRKALQEEYDAVTLASQVLEQANLTLQQRFSPALGEKSAEIFTKLTQGKYNKVLLNKTLTPSAQEKGSLLPRETFQLSQGTADQLYLAVRLAICEMVLPADKAAPLVLDDALVTFDDDRMAQALSYLVQLSQRRQILLFTCQSREAACLRDRHLPGVRHIRL